MQQRPGGAGHTRYFSRLKKICFAWQTDQLSYRTCDLRNTLKPFATKLLQR